MIPRAAFSLALTAALLAGRAGAQDAKDPAAPAAAAPKADVPKKAPAKAKQKAGERKKKPAAESKYKSRALTENGASHYRFDAEANPIDGAEKKSSAKAREKPAGDPAGKPVCSDEAPCSEKKSSDADAL